MTIHRIFYFRILASAQIFLAGCGANPFKHKANEEASAPTKIISTASGKAQWAGAPNLHSIRLSSNNTLSAIAIPVDHFSVVSGVPDSAHIAFDKAATTSVTQPALSSCDTTGIVGAFQLSSTSFVGTGFDVKGAGTTCTIQLSGLVSTTLIVELKDVPVIMDHGAGAVISTLTVTIHP